MIELDHEIDKASTPNAIIKVVGVGGAGCNTVNSMMSKDYKDIEFIVVNTDAQALAQSSAHHKIQIGTKSTKGLGAGANPEIGKKAAEENLDAIVDVVGSADIVFLTGGMGGGTGSGAIPVIAHALKELGILTIAVITKPFVFEGKRRERIALDAIEIIKKEVDTLIIIPNQKLLELVDKKVSMLNAFAMINDVLNQFVKSIADIITKNGYINVDFADVYSILHNQGLAVMGTGVATGEERALKAAISAISSPLLENMQIKGAMSVLINVSGSSNLGIHEIHEAASLIYQEADVQANIILGSVIDDSLGDNIIITVIATGFARTAEIQPALSAPEQAATPKDEPKVTVRETAVFVKDNWEAPTAEAVTPAGIVDELDVPAFLRQNKNVTDMQ